jgi:hypothetical protein
MVQYVLLNNIILLVTLTNFEPNLVFVNINKLKPYQFIASEVQNFELSKKQFTKRNQQEGECIIGCFNIGRNYTPYKSLQDSLKSFKWTWFLFLKILLF